MQRLRQWLTMALFALPLPGATAPILTVERPDLVDDLTLRFVAPDGSIAAQYDGGKASSSSWQAPVRWYRGPGTYGVIGLSRGPLGEALIEASFEVDDTDRRLEWSHAGTRLDHVRKGGARARVELAPDLYEYRVFNDSDQTIYAGSEFTDHVSLEVQERDGWRALGRHHRSSGRQEGIPPGASRAFPVDWVDLSTLAPGRYRVTSAYDLAPTTRNSAWHVVEGFSYEIVSSPIDYTPGAFARACELRSGKSFGQRTKSKFQAYLSLNHTAAGVFLTKTTGERVRLDPEPRAAAPVMPYAETVVSADGRTVLVHSDGQRLLSFDGGASFRPIGLAELLPGRQWVLAGKRLFELSPDGSAWWRHDDGSAEPIDLPVRAEWQSAAFRDELHGVLVGRCSVMLETADGGKSWALTPLAVDFGSQVQWTGPDLYFANHQAVFVRRAGSEAFQEVVRGRCGIKSDTSAIVCRSSSFTLRRDETVPPPVAPLPVHVRGPDGSFSLLARPDETGWLRNATTLDDGSVLLFYTLTSRVVRVRDGQATVVLDGHDTEAIREARERSEEFERRFRSGAR